MSIPNYSTPIAVLIDAPRTAAFLGNLNPAIKELDYDKDLHQRYFVMDWPGDGQFVIMAREQFENIFEVGTDAWFLKPFLVEEKGRNSYYPDRYVPLTQTFRQE